MSDSEMNCTNDTCFLQSVCGSFTKFSSKDDIEISSLLTKLQTKSHESNQQNCLLFMAHKPHIADVVVNTKPTTHPFYGHYRGRPALAGTSS